jgi:hypothetical protein
MKPVAHKTQRVSIMRRPVFQEDEGRHTFIMSATKEEADSWIAAQKDEYFKPSNYYISTPPPPHHNAT